MKNSQKGFAIPLIIAIVALLIAGGAYVYINKNIANPNVSNIVGGDKDEHGCIGSAGYSWCAVKNKCLRTWEEKCEVTSSAVAPENQIGYVKSIYQKNGKYYLSIDYVQLITDTKTCQTSNKWESFSNGYCIVNPNPLIRTLEIVPTASVKVTANIDTNGKFDNTQGYSAAGRSTTLAALLKAFNNPSNLLLNNPAYKSKYFHSLFNIKINSSGKIVDINEQYIP